MGLIARDQKRNGIKYNGFFGMFDILGYKDLIEHNTLDDIVDIYYNNILNREEPAFAFGNSHTPDLSPSVQAEKLAFSDTFILYSQFYDGENSIEKLQRAFAYVFYSAYLLRFSFDSGIPLRGALCFGEYYVDKENICFLGSPILEAYNASNKQNWCGAVICNSAYNVIKEILRNNDVLDYIHQMRESCKSKKCDCLSDKDIDELIIEYKIPYKDYCSEKCRYSKENALRWDDFACRNIVGLVSEYINVDAKKGDVSSYQGIHKIVRAKFSAHNKDITGNDIRKKIEETSKFFDYINNNYSRQFVIEKPPSSSKHEVPLKIKKLYA